MSEPAIPADLRPDEVQHVVPVDDLKAHVIDTRGRCWCRPEPDIDWHGCTWVHNAMDGREDFETGKRLPS